MFVMEECPLSLHCQMSVQCYSVYVGIGDELMCHVIVHATGQSEPGCRDKHKSKDW